MLNEIFDRAFIEDEMKFYNIPGLALGVIKDGEVLASEGFGYRDLEKKLPVTSDTQFGIASCSKSFTSAIIAQLVDEGIVDYDTPVKQYLPDFEMYDPITTQHCCLRDILTHRTGLAPHETIWADRTADRASIWRRLKYLQPMAEFRKETLYSNNMYTMAGYIAERLTGKSWDELVKERIFEPLGMNNSNTSVDDMVKAPDYAHGYLEVAEGDIQFMEKWNVDLGGPAAGVNTSTEDFLKWVELHIRKGEWNGKQLVSKENMEEMHKMQTTIYNLPWCYLYPETQAEVGYGMAWFTDSYKGDEFVWHLGEIEGYCSFEGFLPGQNLGITMMMNLHKPCGPIINTLAYYIIDKVLGREVTDWSARIRPWNRKYEGLYYHWDVNLLPDEPKADAPMTHAPEAYVGKYFNPGYGEFTVEYEDGKWNAHYNGVDYPMEHYHYDVLKMLNVKGDTIFVTLPVSFIIDPYTGDINSFTAAFDPDVDPILFERM